MIYAPGGCRKLPLDVTRNQIRAAGAQVILVSTGCGVGPSYSRAVFDWSNHEETQPRGFTDFPACGPDYKRTTYDSQLVRYYEDSTRLSAGAGDSGDRITTATAAAFQRCGVDLVGFDQLVPDDLRLRFSIWSWAPYEPRAGRGCAVERVNGLEPFGRWHAESCGLKRRVACRAGTRWLVLRSRLRGGAPAVRACRRAHARWAVPRTGYENQLLRLAMTGVGVHTVWLGERLVGGVWRAQDKRSG